jgi:Ser/Thr protein kinase RdoA (MazF antagonist)
MKTVNLTVKNTLFEVDSIKNILQTVYPLPAGMNLQFMRAGVNDTYVVNAKTSKYIFRIYRFGLRSYDEIEFELKLLNHLKTKGADVSYPIKNSNGHDIIPINSPEGLRYGVLFSYADGDAIKYTDEKGEMADAYGRSLAKIHLAQTDFSSDYQRPINQETLLLQPLEKIKTFFADHQENFQIIKDTTAFVASEFAKLADDALTPGFCHGDSNCGNANINANKLTFFDFDCCGFGWLEYDLATFYWGAFLINKKQRWQPFIKAYCQVNTQMRINQDAIALLVAMRQVWLMGLHHDAALLYGNSWYNKQYFDANAQFFITWKKNYLEKNI